MFSVLIDTRQFESDMGRFLVDLRVTSTEALREMGRVTAERISRRYYVNRTGKLTNSIEHHSTGDLSWRVKASAPYAHFVDVGTKPHRIVAKRGKVLAFYWGKMGEWVFFRGVNHPGTKATNFSIHEAWNIASELPRLAGLAVSQSVSNTGVG